MPSGYVIFFVHVCIHEHTLRDVAPKLFDPSDSARDRLEARYDMDDLEKLASVLSAASATTFVCGVMAFVVY